MSVLATKVDQIRERMKKGYPTGVDEESYTQFPILFHYIDELERALYNMGRVAEIPTNEGRQIVEIYKSDAEFALNLIRRDELPKSKEIYYPA
jgi:hypothetical protein